MDEYVVHAPRLLDRTTSSAFHRAVLGVVEDHLGNSCGSRLVIDLSGTARVDSAGLGALVMVQEAVSRVRRAVTLHGVSEELRLLLVLTRLEDRFELEPPAA